MTAGRRYRRGAVAGAAYIAACALFGLQRTAQTVHEALAGDVGWALFDGLTAAVCLTFAGVGVRSLGAGWWACPPSSRSTAGPAATASPSGPESARGGRSRFRRSCQNRLTARRSTA